MIFFRSHLAPPTLTSQGQSHTTPVRLSDLSEVSGLTGLTGLTNPSGPRLARARSDCRARGSDASRGGNEPHSAVACNIWLKCLLQRRMFNRNVQPPFNH